MNKGELKSIFVVHTNGGDEWIRVPKKTYDRFIDQMLSLENAEPIPYSTLMGIKIIEDPSMDGVDFSVGYVQ